MVVGAFTSDAGGSNSGAAYMVLGKATPFTANVALGALNGANGFRLAGDVVNRLAAYSVQLADDRNEDGFDDVIIGGPGAATATNFVVYGASNFSASIPLASLDGTNGFIVFSLASPVVSQAGSTGTQTLTGTASVDILVGGVGGDSLVGNGGADVLRGGQSDDVLSFTGGPLQRLVVGHGFDRLEFNGNLLLDLTSRWVYRVSGVEPVDLRTGANNLSLNARAVVNASPDTNTLILRSNTDDIVKIGKLSDWTALGNDVIEGDTFTVPKQGEAILKVSSSVAPVVTLVNATTATYRDVDGALVTIKTGRGTLGISDFYLVSADTVGGDGRVNVGRIDAPGVDIGAVSIEGDLGRVNAGDGDGRHGDTFDSGKLAEYALSVGGGRGCADACP